MHGSNVARLALSVSLLIVTFTLCARISRAQDADSTLTQSEVDKLRDTAYRPADRVIVFVKIIDQHSQKIQDLVTQPRHAGREDELHDLFTQMGSIVDELNDNLDEYELKHRDIRKSLPKLLDATERWATTLRAAPDDERYKVARRLALASVRDAHEAAERLAPAQAAYFKEHPEAAKAEQDREDHDPH